MYNFAVAWRPFGALSNPATESKDLPVTKSLNGGKV